MLQNLICNSSLAVLIRELSGIEVRADALQRGLINLALTYAVLCVTPLKVEGSAGDHQAEDQLAAVVHSGAGIEHLVLGAIFQMGDANGAAA